MESSNRVPICLSGYDAFAVRWVVPVPDLTGIAITSRRSHNLLKLICSAKPSNSYAAMGKWAAL